MFVENIMNYKREFSYGQRHFFCEYIIHLKNGHKKPLSNEKHATTSCKSTRDTVPYFGTNGLSMILCL